MEKSSFCSLEAFLVRKGKKGMPRSAPRASVSWDARGGGGGGGGGIERDPAKNPSLIPNRLSPKAGLQL